MIQQYFATVIFRPDHHYSMCTSDSHPASHFIETSQSHSSPHAQSSTSHRAVQRRCRIATPHSCAPCTRPPSLDARQPPHLHRVSSQWYQAAASVQLRSILRLSSRVDRWFACQTYHQQNHLPTAFIASSLLSPLPSSMAADLSSLNSSMDGMAVHSGVEQASSSATSASAVPASASDIKSWNKHTENLEGYLSNTIVNLKQNLSKKEKANGQSCHRPLTSCEPTASLTRWSSLLCRFLS
jgi:hypothetical protein